MCCVYTWVCCVWTKWQPTVYSGIFWGEYNVNTVPAPMYCRPVLCNIQFLFYSGLPSLYSLIFLLFVTPSSYCPRTFSSNLWSISDLGLRVCFSVYGVLGTRYTKLAWYVSIFRILIWRFRTLAIGFVPFHRAPCGRGRFIVGHCEAFLFKFYFLLQFTVFTNYTMYSSIFDTWCHEGGM